ncbi:hypothetical protein TEA_007871 [Camellia sinensis var. sinensis]|uniref:Erythromycin biosynthesis protein CIII-like C-terminal domain-containing protein n=1 Tax=Camellia sinensis var. sinensis TaxID=542762 RepID=A0A4S4E2R1_CAMSN|nr:hypothetical protein TEA_007871 [Camellia sinensis var. sinensis]
MRRRRSQTRQNFNKQGREVRRERCPAQTSVTCDGSRRTPSFFALHACELELTREAPAAALDRSRSHLRRSRSFLQALVRRAPLRSPLCRRLAFHALCSSLRSSLRSLRHRRPRPRLAPGLVGHLPRSFPQEDDQSNPLQWFIGYFCSNLQCRIGHAHVAEALAVPLHIFFTMPWMPTYEFPHPLARVPQSAGYWLSIYLIWWGIRGYINDFRKRNLKLAPIAYFSLYCGSVSRLPTAYMWSRHVMPKPSVPEVSDSVFPLEDCPHDWLFPQCLAVLYMPGNTTQMHSFVMHFKVTDLCDRSLKGNGIVMNVQVHHGSAGTTATGLRAGCPTTIVPLFGDQFFWGERIYEKGLGPAPIPISQLNVESLSDAVQFMLQPEVKSQAMEIAKSIENEDGVAAAVDAFHRHLPSELPLPSCLAWLFLRLGNIDIRIGGKLGRFH